MCAVEASATNREGMRLGPKKGQKGGADPLDVAKARLAVDLGNRLSGALRRAARPSADSTSHLDTEPSSCAMGSGTGEECEDTETGAERLCVRARAACKSIFAAGVQQRG